MPLATYTGWSLRSGSHASDGCEGTGQMIAFAKTKAERLASGDPRPSVEERYASAEVYSAAARQAIEDLVAKRYMLREDADAYFQRMTRLWQKVAGSGPASQQTR